MRQCDECDNRVMKSMMRKCETCEKQLMTRTEYKLECIVCLECCVNSHNGHQFTRYNTAPSTSIESSPMMQQRARHPSTSSTVSVHFRHPSAVTGRLSTKGIINSIKSWSFRSSNELSFVLTPPSKLAFSEEDIVMQCQSPFYDKDGQNRQQQQLLRNRMSSSRFICYDSNLPDNTSVDSVFVDTPQSLPNSVTQRMPSNRSSFIQHKNDSGVVMGSPSSSSPTTPSLNSSQNHFSHSATSLRIPSPATTSKIQTIQNFFGTSRAPRSNRVRVGMTDMMSTPRRPMPLYTSTPNNLNAYRNTDRPLYQPTPTVCKQRQYF